MLQRDAARASRSGASPVAHGGGSHERQQIATAPITCGSPRHEGGRRLFAGGYGPIVLVRTCADWTRATGDRVRLRLFERAIDAGARFALDSDLNSWLHKACGDRLNE
jgi:hypothetical protein